MVLILRSSTARHCYLLLLLPTNAATCDGPHSSRVIGPCSQSPSNQRRAPGLWGKPPQYGVTGGSDRQTGQRVMLESQVFLSIHLRATDTAVKLDTNTTTQGRNSERDQERVLFFVFLFELEGICCARFKSRVTLMSFQFCN